MAEDVEIDIKVELEKALADLKKLEDHIQATKAKVDQGISPSVDNFGTKLEGAGGKISGFGQKIKNNISGETALAFTALSAGVTSFTKGCIDSAISSEAAWSRFGALVNQSGGNWQAQSKEVKEWATKFSNSMGYATGDTREAMTTMMQYGMTLEETKSAMNGVAGLAARTGQTQAEAAAMVTSALNGRFNQLTKVTGLQKEDYLLADGSIDQQKLLNDLYNQNTDALEAHGKTTEAQMNKISNSWGKLKTGIGQALLPVITLIADFVEKAVDGFNSLDGPIKPLIAGVLAVVAVFSGLIGILGIIAPILINVGTLISKTGKLYQKLKLAKGIGESWSNFKDKINGVKTAISNLNLGNKVQSVKSAVISSWNVLRQNINRAKDAITKFELRQKLATIAQKAHSLATMVWNGITKVATTVQAAFNAVMAMNPIYLVIIAILALVAVLTYLYFNNEQVRNAINALGDYLKGIFLPIWDALSGAIKGVVEWFQQVFSGSKTLTEALGDVVNAILQFTGLGAVIEVLQNIWDMIGPVAQGIWDSFVNALSGLGEWLWNTLSDIPRIVGEALSNLGSQIVPGGGILEGLLGIIAPIPMMLFTAITNIAPQVLPAVWGLVDSIVQGFWGIGERIVSFFLNLPQQLLMTFTNIIVNIQLWFQQAGANIGILIQGLIQAVTTQFWQLVFNVGAIFSNILGTIWNVLTQGANIAGGLAGQLRTAVTSVWNTLVSRAGEIFGRVLNAIKNKLLQIVTNGKTKAKDLVTSYVNKVKELPGKVGTEIANLATTIKNKLVEAGKRAFEGAKNLVAQFLAGMGIHSPGIIQRMTAIEMSSIPQIIYSQGVLAAKATMNMAQGIVGAWENNMTTLYMGDIKAGKIGNITPFNNSVLTTPLGNPVQTALMSIPLGETVSNSNISRATRNNQNNVNKTLVIENINLELGNLDVEQSKRVVFTAIQDVYTGI